MNDYISRQAAIDEIRKCRFVVDAIENIRGLPTADVRENVNGEWIVEDGEVVCSECGEPHIETNFCPNCGADMRGGVV